MNTTKQVNVMIGLLLLISVFYAANVLNEPSRQDEAVEEQIALFAERGAEIFVSNCRSCHGLQGLGSNEGAIGQPLNTPAYLILGEDNAFGLEPTAAGVANGIRDYLTNTIACGRTNTVMPVWGEQFGGSLSVRQVEYLVTLITEGRWDLVEELGRDLDEHQNPPATRDDVIVGATGLSVTKENCGQFNASTAAPFRERDPFASGPSATETPAPGASAEPAGGTPAGDDPSAAVIQNVPVGDYFANLCASCHGLQRQGGVGLPLTRDLLTQSDDFYIDTITNGRAGTAMTPYGGGTELTASEVQAIVTWLKNTDP